MCKWPRRNSNQKTWPFPGIEVGRLESKQNHKRTSSLNGLTGKLTWCLPGELLLSDVQYLLFKELKKNPSRTSFITSSWAFSVRHMSTTAVFHFEKNYNLLPKEIFMKLVDAPTRSIFSRNKRFDNHFPS